MTINNYLENALYDVDRAVYRLSLLDESNYFLTEEENKKWYQKAWEAIVKFFKKLWEGVKAVIRWIAEKVSLLAKAVWNTIKKVFSKKKNKNEPVKVKAEAVKPTATDTAIKSEKSKLANEITALEEASKKVKAAPSKAAENSKTESVKATVEKQAEQVNKTIISEKEKNKDAILSMPIGKLEMLVETRLKDLTSDIEYFQKLLVRCEAALATNTRNTQDFISKSSSEHHIDTSDEGAMDDVISDQEVIKEYRNIGDGYKKIISEIQEIIKENTRKINVINSVMNSMNDIDEDKAEKMSTKELSSKFNKTFDNDEFNKDILDQANGSNNRSSYYQRNNMEEKYQRQRTKANKQVDKSFGESYDWIDFLL